MPQHNFMPMGAWKGDGDAGLMAGGAASTECRSTISCLWALGRGMEMQVSWPEARPAPNAAAQFHAYGRLEGGWRCRSHGRRRGQHRMPQHNFMPMGAWKGDGDAGLMA